ncbi:heptaprenyl diphosphate synthase component II [Pseudalkalibacillus berkeleyi]|uniref:Heptaprenyl diphosphate synthase component II n=1 Tax=Pseudalkalibacillus berkeleyi TaxID=1069813 RepID=A0ABS9GXU0_9BACL|nr:heptaprenyl diphosphate synthase component II [Pseudalkalibacillus berkeleyi]MCF6137577.1 heptaprenyl diphosphate synthase component II [Pseudalkalibacillus berkeleyi]
MKLTTIYSHLRSDLSTIEKDLEKTIEAQHAILQDASTQLLKAGGKRIRPVFVLLSAQFGTYDVDRVKRAAVALELIHMASLVHDDVIDDASLRRGKSTIKAQWDNRVAMYTGDYIFARSLEYITHLNKVEAHNVLSHAIVEMCLGEIEQIREQYDLSQNLRDYFRRIKRKTALLISVSCELGAIAGDADSDTQLQLKRFGYYVGMAFQITDDILDFTSTEKQLGKPAGGDLQQGNITLPVFFAREDEEINTQLHALFENQPISRLDIEKLLHAIKETDAINRSKEIADRYLQKAFIALDQLPDNRAKKSLRQIAEYIGRRNY